MIYFSELKGKKVITEDQVYVGNLQDLIFLAQDKPDITKFVIKTPSGERLIIPIEYLHKVNANVTIKKDFVVTDLRENELYVVLNLLDKQIIDLAGNKIVRVNDVAIQEKDKPYLAGVDVGILGILRWLRIERIINKIAAIFNFQLTSKFLSWVELQPLELARGKVKLKKEEKKLEKMRPEDLADYLQKTNVLNTKKVLGILEDKFAANVIQSLNINYQTAIFKSFEPEKAARFISFLETDEGLDVLLAMTAKRREQILEHIQSEKKKELLHVMQYAKSSIGELMTTEFLTVRSEQTVRNVLDRVRKETVDFRILTAIYVLNAENQLIGVFGLHDLVLQNFDNPIYKFMVQNVVVVHFTTPAEIVLKRMLKYRLTSLPVIDDEKRIQGIVTLDDIATFVISKQA